MWNLVGDIGGTHMRLAAMSPAGDVFARHSSESDGHISLLETCMQFIAGQDGDPGALVIAAAGPVLDGQVKLTNANQTLKETDLSALCPGALVRILNDFEAAAWSLASVVEADVEMVQGQLGDRAIPRLIIGPGTGLGVGALIRAGGRPHVIAGEGGHVALAPRTREEVEIFAELATRLPEFRIGDGLAVEAEAILSGTGVPHFHQSVAKVRGLHAEDWTAERIFDAARDRTDSGAVATVDHFRSCLGALAGDLGLAFGAWGGVFITGGVAQANRWMFDNRFLDAFNAGGRHTTWRKQLPVCLYQDENFGLLGARNFIAAQET